MTRLHKCSESLLFACDFSYHSSYKLTCEQPHELWPAEQHADNGPLRHNRNLPRWRHCVDCGPPLVALISVAVVAV